MKLSLWSFERFREEQEEGEDNSPTEETSLSSLDSSTQSLLSSLISSYHEIGKKIESLKESQDLTKGEIEEICLNLPYKKISSDTFSAIRTRKSSSKFNKSKAISECLSRNIDPIDFLDILTLSTEKKKGEEYVMITDPEKKRKGKEK